MAEILEGAVTEPDDVREILDTDLTDPRLANFINMAYVIVKDLGVTDAEVLRMMELLLAAHFTTTYEGVLKSQSVGGGEWSVSYATIVGEGLAASPYGQQAIAIDPTRKLQSMALKRAAFHVTSAYELDGSGYLLTGVVE